jgi:predicted ferric reductase
MVEQQGVPVVPVGPQGPTQMQLRPHRGGIILALGILGIVCCFILGIIAWVMGNNDLKEMAAGRMDPSGEGLTQAGKICGMVSVILQIVVILIWILFMAIGIGSATMNSM